MNGARISRKGLLSRQNAKPGDPRTECLLVWCMQFDRKPEGMTFSIDIRCVFTIAGVAYHRRHAT